MTDPTTALDAAQAAYHAALDDANAAAETAQ